MVIILLPLALTLLAIGTWLLARGLRGHAVDDHPVCRRCRFDLVGLPASSSRCSECGADLSAPGAIRAGNRHRRPGLVAAGVVLILPCLFTGALLIWAAATDVHWIEYAPHWYLLRQATNPTPAVHDPALAEFARRQTVSLLSDAQLASLVDAGLALQADRSATWVPKWGDLIEAARAAGKVPDEKWRQYLTAAPAVSLSVRPEVRRGDNLIVRVNELPARCGTLSSLWAWVTYDVQPDSDLVDPRRSGGGRMGSSLSATGSGWLGNDYPLPPDKVAAAADGPKTLHTKVRLDLYSRMGPSSPPSTAPPEATATFDLHGTWSLVPANAPTVRPIDDPARRPAVEHAIKVESIRVNPGSKNHLDIQFGIHSPSVPLAYRVTLRAGGREWPGVTTVAVPATADMGYGTGGDVKDFNADRVDVILRPDPAVATTTVDLREYWNGEIVLRDVPVQRPTQ